MGVAGRRRLVAQPGGLTLGFARRLVFRVRLKADVQSLALNQKEKKILGEQNYQETKLT